MYPEGFRLRDCPGRWYACSKLRDHDRLDHQREGTVLDVGVKILSPYPIGDLLYQAVVAFRVRVSKQLTNRDGCRFLQGLSDTGREVLV